MCVCVFYVLLPECTQRSDEIRPFASKDRASASTRRERKKEKRENEGNKVVVTKNKAQLFCYFVEVRVLLFRIEDECAVHCNGHLTHKLLPNTILEQLQPSENVCHYG